MDDAKSGTVSLLSNGGPGVAISMDGGVEDKHRYHQQLQLIDEQVKKHRWIDLIELKLYVHTHTHTRTRLTALFPGLPGWASTRKVKPIWILLKQETE